MFGKFFLVTWIVIVSLVITLQMAQHILILPTPKSNNLFVSFIDSFLPGKDNVTIIHIIPVDCSCSDSLIGELINNKTSKGVEYVVLLENRFEKEKLLRKEGYRVKVLDESKISAVGIKAGPVLIIKDGKNLKYVGGYFKTSATIKSNHSKIIRAYLNKSDITPFSIYGCPIDKELKEAFNPFLWFREWVLGVIA